MELNKLVPESPEKKANLTEDQVSIVQPQGPRQIANQQQKVITKNAANGTSIRGNRDSQNLYKAYKK